MYYNDKDLLLFELQVEGKSLQVYSVLRPRFFSTMWPSAIDSSSFEQLFKYFLRISRYLSTSYIHMHLIRPQIASLPATWCQGLVFGWLVGFLSL